MPLVLCHGVRTDYLQCHLCMCEGLSPAFSHHWLITPILQMEDIYLIDICNYNYIRLCTRNQVTMLITHHSPGWELSRFVQDGSGHQHLHHLQWRVYQTDRIFPFVWIKLVYTPSNRFNFENRDWQLHVEQFESRKLVTWEDFQTA